jgi:cytochrome c oxidase cbb3-type subunit I/II
MTSPNDETGRPDGAKDSPQHTDHWHRRLLEGRGALFAVATTVAISIGGIAEIIPLIALDPDVEARERILPRTALEVAGRDLYARDGCMLCHSQMVRPFRSETLRYGEWSRSREYIWDRPFLLGSRRGGPDLHRVGKKYPDSWHYEHMRDPRSTSPGSVMPPFPWLHVQRVDPADIQASMWAQQVAGTPYTDEQIAQAPQSMKEQGEAIVRRLNADGLEFVMVDGPDDEEVPLLDADGNPVRIAWDHEIVALTAYLQSLGRNAPEPVAEGESRDGSAEVTE